MSTKMGEVQYRLKLTMVSANPQHYSSQFGSDDFARWCKDNHLMPSMSRRGNCYDNAVAESFFSSLKKERIKRKIYVTREEAKSEIFEYIEVFYNRTRRHSYLDQLSPMMFEKLQSGT